MARNFTKPGETTIGALARDGTPRYAVLDTVTRSLPMMEYEHYTIHNNFHFLYTDAFELGSAAVRKYLLTTPTHVAGAAFAPGVHMKFKTEGSAITQFEIFEDTTREATTDADQVSFNSNRNSTDTAQLKIQLSSSTDGADGTRIFVHKGGAASQQSRSGERGGSDEEIVLKKNAKYLLKFTSGTASNLCDLHLLWYELDAYS